MQWTEALEIIVDRTGHIRYRELTADDAPDHELWRERVLELAGQPAPPRPPIQYPTVQRQAKTVFRSVKGRLEAGSGWHQSRTGTVQA